MSEINDFVRRHPHGCDVAAPELPKRHLQSYIPALHAQAIVKETLIDLAKERGYSIEDIGKLRTLLYGLPREPVLVSLDEIYGEEEDAS